MSNRLGVVLSWVTAAVYIATVILARQRRHAVPLIPAVNLITGALIMVYWVPKWYSYLFKGITFYATDQLVPVYALLVIVLSLFALAGRSPGDWPHWIILTVDLIVSLAAGFFFTFVRFNKRLF